MLFYDLFLIFLSLKTDVNVLHLQKVLSKKPYFFGNFSATVLTDPDPKLDPILDP
jgi:hypothetical protein